MFESLPISELAKLSWRTPIKRQDGFQWKCNDQRELKGIHVLMGQLLDSRAPKTSCTFIISSTRHLWPGISNSGAISITPCPRLADVINLLTPSLVWIPRNIVAMSRIPNRWYLLDGCCRRLFVLHQIVKKCYSPRHLHRWVADVLALVFRATASKLRELKFDRRTQLMNIDSQLDLSWVIKYLQGISTVLPSVVCNFRIPHKIQQLAQLTQPTNHSTQAHIHTYTYNNNTQDAPIHLSCRLPGYCFGCACCSRLVWATSRDCKFWLYLAFDGNILMMI